MKISRENYELWFTDWLDNNLTTRQTDELYAFLELNRDLKEDFNALSSIKLEPEEIFYPGKDNLRKAPQQISPEQFELLCAASMENDLSAEQEKELEEMISSNPERRKTAEIYKAIRLHPSGEVFAGRNKLFQKTAGQKIIRMAIIGLSAAAVIALIITTGRFRQPGISDSVPEVRLASNENQPSTPGIPRVDSPVINTMTTEKVSAQVKSSVTAENLRETVQPEIIFSREQVPGKITFTVISSLAGPVAGNSLIASAIPNNPESGMSTADDRSNIGRFLAHTFRSKVLDESSDEPLKAYEIAEAGINGINKLLGWEMALNRNSDENGEVQSVYFSSRMLKFNAPVKNNDIAE